MKLEITNIVKKIPLPRQLKKFIRRIIRTPFFYFISSKPQPISSFYGLDRGKPIDRFYIENFLEKNRNLIKGECLELLNNSYTKKYGGEKISKSDILDIEENNTNATIIDDLRKLQTISDNTYDCIILTQVFQFIDDLDSALSACYRILKKEGVLLVTLPSLSRIDCISGVDGDYWRFTKAGAKYLFEKHFSSEKLEIETKGNARSGIYFYSGLAQEDVSRKTLLVDDGNFPLIVTVKATK